MYVIINEHKFSGGTEVFVQKLKAILLKNKLCHKSVYINGGDCDCSSNEINLKFQGSKWSKIFISPKLIIKLKKIINRNDICIVNNIFSSPISIYICLILNKAIRIIHDYSIVCPKSTCIKDDGMVCNGYKFEHCLLNCNYHDSKIQLLIKLMLTYITGWLGKKAIRQFISPSKKLAKYAKTNGFNCVAIPNPVSLSIVKEHKINRFNHHYIYIGGLNKNKGLYDMLPAFAKFSASRNNVCLDIYGKTANVGDEKILKAYESEKIIYHGSVSHDEIQNILQSGYALLVPSLWMENYPTTVLEGFANRLLVIGSDRGGIPEMLENNRGICYRYGHDELINALEKAEKVSKVDYEAMTNNGIKYILENNTDEIYFKRLRKYLQ